MARCGECVGELVLGVTFWPAVLAGSVSLWYVTLFLRSRPDFLYYLVTVCGGGGERE